jgi:hypothetical protein
MLSASYGLNFTCKPSGSQPQRTVPWIGRGCPDSALGQSTWDLWTESRDGIRWRLLRFYLVATIPRRLHTRLRLNLYQKDKRPESSNKSMLFMIPGSSEQIWTSYCFVRHRDLLLPTPSQSLPAFINFEDWYGKKSCPPSLPAVLKMLKSLRIYRGCSVFLFGRHASQISAVIYYPDQDVRGFPNVSRLMQSQDLQIGYENFLLEFCVPIRKHFRTLLNAGEKYATEQTSLNTLTIK